ncbi:MAG: hypothetical protein LC779_07045, partial [Actinobacteria bacterium]|nr:hypothetical protein [Actinomycetota bacterium]
MFDAQAAVDMDVLARQVGVSRATLYRVVSSRERLLGDVLWEQGRQIMAYADRRADGEGPERLVRLARLFNERV